MSGAAAAGPGVSLDAWPHLFEPGSPDAPVLLTLHGTGGNEAEIAAIAPHLLPGAGILSPRGRVSEHGMNRWFRRIAEGVFDVEDVIARAGELAAFIALARAHYGLGDRRMLAVGFSNGANIALATALLHPEALDRVVAFSGMFPFGDRDPISKGAELGFQQRVPGAKGQRHVVLSPAHHFLQEDQPEAIAERIHAFVAKS